MGKDHKSALGFGGNSDKYWVDLDFKQYLDHVDHTGVQTKTDKICERVYQIFLELQAADKRKIAENPGAE